VNLLHARLTFITFLAIVLSASFAFSEPNRRLSGYYSIEGKLPDGSKIDGFAIGYLYEEDHTDPEYRVDRSNARKAIDKVKPKYLTLKDENGVKQRAKLIWKKAGDEKCEKIGKHFQGQGIRKDICDKMAASKTHFWFKKAPDKKAKHKKTKIYDGGWENAIYRSFNDIGDEFNKFIEDAGAAIDDVIDDMHFDDFAFKDEIKFSSDDCESSSDKSGAGFSCKSSFQFKVCATVFGAKECLDAGKIVAKTYGVVGLVNYSVEGQAAIATTLVADFVAEIDDAKVEIACVATFEGSGKKFEYSLPLLDPVNADSTQVIEILRNAVDKGKNKTGKAKSKVKNRKELHGYAGKISSRNYKILQREQGCGYAVAGQTPPKLPISAGLALVISGDGLKGGTDGVSADLSFGTSAYAELKKQKVDWGDIKFETPGYKIETDKIKLFDVGLHVPAPKFYVVSPVFEESCKSKDQISRASFECSTSINLTACFEMFGMDECLGTGKIEANFSGNTGLISYVHDGKIGASMNAETSVGIKAFGEEVEFGISCLISNSAKSEWSHTFGVSFATPEIPSYNSTDLLEDLNDAISEDHKDSEQSSSQGDAGNINDELMEELQDMIPCTLIFPEQDLFSGVPAINIVDMGLKVSAKAKNWKIKQDSISADLVLSLGASASLIGGSAFGQDLPGYEWDGFSEDILVQQIKFEM
jgi:hypothetical protein